MPWRGLPDLPRLSTRRVILGSSMRGGVVGFEAGVDAEGAVVAPVFVVDEAVDAVDVI